MVMFGHMQTCTGDRLASDKALSSGRAAQAIIITYVFWTQGSHSKAVAVADLQVRKSTRNIACVLRDKQMTLDL
jgi:hypothetical protein